MNVKNVIEQFLMFFFFFKYFIFICNLIIKELT